MPNSVLSGVLADTWWYGMSQRCSEENFDALARLRASQGFNAIQLVVGIPPETGPENRENWSKVGPAWDLEGNINHAYLTLAATRIGLLNSLGLKVLVYASWGHQIEWLGSEKMTLWWLAVNDALKDFDVEYCLTGELDLWLDQPERLLPANTTEDIHNSTQASSWLSEKYNWYVGRHIKRRQRIRQWKHVAFALSQVTQRELFVHPTVHSTGKSLLGEAVSIETIITGHNPHSHNALWQQPTERRKYHNSVINLEPWYEGIHDSFGTEDQLYAYWCSMLAGCEGHCYGAQGIWNMGDGEFLSHWGKQTYAQAMQLTTPHLLGESHKIMLQHLSDETLQTAKAIVANDSLLSLTNRSHNTHFEFIPDVSQHIPEHISGLIWLPEKAIFSVEPPASGPMVLINPADQVPG